MKTLLESETETELRQLFMRIALEIEREELPVFARFPWLKKISSILERGCDWEPVAMRFFKVGDGRFPLPDGSEGKAFTGLAPSGTSDMKVGPLTHYYPWQQGDLHLVLGYKDDDPPPQTVKLHVDSPLGETVERLYWIREGRLGNISDIESFAVNQVDESHYTVDVMPGRVAERLRAIKRAQNHAADGNVDIDPRLLLPFVEMA